MRIDTAEINTSEFCYLSSNKKFLQWLFENDTGLHYNLIEHLKLGKGCSANREKMLVMLREVSKDAKLAVSLIEFIRANFPQILVGPRVKNIKDDVVFKFYDPSLHTFPRKMIIEKETGTPLEDQIAKFCADKIACDSLIIGNRAYIEYLLPDHAKLKDSIPEKSWEIMKYKKASSIE